MTVYWKLDETENSLRMRKKLKVFSLPKNKAISRCSNVNILFGFVQRSYHFDPHAGCAHTAKQVAPPEQVFSPENIFLLVFPYLFIRDFWERGRKVVNLV